MAYENHSKVSRMSIPEKLNTEAYLPWSRGRGVDVWAMLCAAVAGDLETIKSLTARDPGLINCELEYYTPFRLAVRENHRHVVDFLLENAVSKPYEEFGANILTLTRDRGYDELAAFFEAKLKELYHIVPEGLVMTEAVKTGDITQVRALLAQQPALVHAADGRGNQPIHWAVLTRQINMIDVLLEHGANMEAQRPDGCRPIDLTNGDYFYRSWYRDLPPAGLRKHEVLVGYLAARGAYVNISVAAKVGYYQRVRELLDQDPELVNRVPDHAGYYSGLPLRCAAGAGHIEIVKLLLERGANPNEPEPGIAPQGGALHAAIGGRHFHIVKLLLEHGANPNAHVESSGNCYWRAKHVEAPEEILKAIAARGGAKDFDLIFYDDDVETFAAILRACPQVYLTDIPYHRGCMELALQYQPDIIKRVTVDTDDAVYGRWLLERGADASRGNWLGITPLHRYAGRGNIEMAALCLEHGATMNAVETDNASTPLGWAAREGKKEMVEWLLQKGADPHLPADEPWALPVEWAKRRGHKEIVRLLEQQG